MHEETANAETGFDRRGFMKRAAVVGAATAWATPTIQSLASPAFALGSPSGGCTACITGGGNKILGASSNDGPGVISLGVGQLCCTQPGPGNSNPQIEINFHNDDAGNQTDKSFHFDTLTSLTCSKVEPVPSPPPETAGCANVFVGTATDSEGNTLTFRFEDHGEGGDNVDVVGVTITGPGTNISGLGILTKGNLQVHTGLGPITHDCSGC